MLLMYDLSDLEIEFPITKYGIIVSKTKNEFKADEGVPCMLIVYLSVHLRLIVFVYCR